jgi:hypothetical protein
MIRKSIHGKFGRTQAKSSALRYCNSVLLQQEVLMWKSQSSVSMDVHKIHLFFYFMVTATT